MKYTVQEYYDMTDERFREIYEDKAFKDILDFLETRIRLEILSIIRRFQLKGDVLFEVRKKSTSSAYSKLQSELVVRQSEFGNRPVYLFEILKDLVGARIICVHEEVQKRVFEYILQVESIVIQSDGLEFYSAPFRDYTLAKDIHEELLESVKGVKSSWSNKNESSSSNKEIEKKSKLSNYESLHFYVKFGSTIDSHLLHQLANVRRDSSEGERIRDRAEGDYLISLHRAFTDEQLKLVSEVPIECQVRTITDHLWAQEEHKYVYKNTSLPIDSEDNSRAIDVLKSTFTGLKYAYYNVDRLRSLVRNVSASHDAPTPTYSGSSKDMNPFRFAFFGDDRVSVEKEFRAVEGAFLEAGKDFANGEVDGRAMLDFLVDLHATVVAADSGQGSHQAGQFHTKSWGRRRLFYLFFAYMALSASNRQLTATSAKKLRENIDLVEIVGEAAFRASMYDEEGSLKLASKLYERVETFDGIARTLVAQSGDLSDEERRVFLDPLVGIRLASSFFLQGEFAGAYKALQSMFKIEGKTDMQSWSKLDLAQDFSLAEILMRYSQYLFFDSFDDEDKLLTNFLELQKIFKNVFSLDTESFNPELYRCFAWYYSLLNYLFTQETLIPSGLSDFKGAARAYLLKFHNEASESNVWHKPETLLVQIYLPLHVSEAEDVSAKVDEAHTNFTEALKDFSSYPRVAILNLKRMAAKLKARTREKSRRDYNSTFISYSQRDSELVEKVVDALKEQGIKIRIDTDFEKGMGITDQVERAMLSANSAVMVVTPEFLNSPWAAEERAFLMDKRRRKELKLFVLRFGVEDDDISERAPLLAGILGYDVDQDNLTEVLATMASEIKKTYR